MRRQEGRQGIAWRQGNGRAVGMIAEHGMVPRVPSVSGDEGRGRRWPLGAFRVRFRCRNGASGERRRLPWNPASAPRLPETLARRSRLSRVWRGADVSPLSTYPLGSRRKPCRFLRHGNCKFFAFTRLALCVRGRIMAVFRFQRRCKSKLKTESDEDVGADRRSSCACLSRVSAGVG